MEEETTVQKYNGLPYYIGGHNKQTDDATENIHLAPLCYADG